MEEAISATLPQKKGTRNRCVFEFARALKAIPGLGENTPKQLKPWVQEWHRRALPNIETKEFSETWTDFVFAWERAQFAKGDEPMVKIVKRAFASEPPRAAVGYAETPRLQKLAALCRELQRHRGTEPFFLSARIAGKYLEVTAMQACRDLKVMVADELLRIERKGGPDMKATRYRYLGD